MPFPLTALILFLTGCLAGFINVMAGGGSSLTLPMLIFLGLDSALANGTNRIALVIQNISAILSFKNEKYSEFGKSFKLALFTLPGAIIGAITAVKIDNLLFQKILGIVMIGIIFTIIMPMKKKETVENIKSKNPWIIYPMLVGIGFYGGFIQVGVGFLFMAALFHTLKISIVRVNMHKVFIILIYTIPALFIFAINGKTDWLLGIILAVGNATGAWWAAKLSIKKGEKLIRIMLIVAIVIMSFKLLKIF